MEVTKRAGSGEEDERYATMDEKKRKRMISNRESARRSRMKRELRLRNLNEQIAVLKNSNIEMVQKINEVTQLFEAVESENRVLKVQKEELRMRLESAEIVASYVGGKSGSGYSMDVYQDGSVGGTSDFSMDVGGTSDYLDATSGYIMDVPQDPWLQPPSITTFDGIFQF